MAAEFRILLRVETKGPRSVERMVCTPGGADRAALYWFDGWSDASDRIRKRLALPPRYVTPPVVYAETGEVFRIAGLVSPCVTGTLTYEEPAKQSDLAALAARVQALEAPRTRRRA